MPDVFTRAKRSDVMSRIRSRGNASTELAFAASMRTAGVTGWRRHVPLRASLRVDGVATALTIRPDFVFRKERVAVFVDGCFWHCCPKHGRLPHSNRLIWKRKLAANLRRDARCNSALRSAGWAVLRLWEHDLKRDSQSCIARIQRRLMARQRVLNVCGQCGPLVSARTQFNKRRIS
jgi:DNA mismatch endonuclease (patch repair protein)